MNDEYLWQKTGEDPEIAAIEKALATFRYHESSPPALTPPVAAARRSWKLVFAFASMAAVALIALSWFQLIKRGDDEIVFVNSTATSPTTSVPVIETPSAAPKSDDVADPRPIRRIELNRTNAGLARRPKGRIHRPQATLAGLTNEEKYAYQQLMLALSISSSKLKVVQDAINGVETNDISAKDSNR